MIVWPLVSPWAAVLDRAQRRPGAQAGPEDTRPGADEQRRRADPQVGGRITSRKVFLTMTIDCIAEVREDSESDAKVPRNGLASRNGYGCDKLEVYYL